ncbi:MAG TPA: hypothetical protein VKR52_20235 [Terracidiphilus sp.]|nr:hypothetical protein [Terracidiphilus sp.]
MKLHGNLRLRIVLIVALCAAFAATPALAEYIASVQTACRGQMPCCPVSSGEIGCTHPQCGVVARLHAELVTTIPARSAVVAADVFRWMPTIVRSRAPFPMAFAPHRPPVFRLKEDLRI